MGMLEIPRSLRMKGRVEKVGQSLTGLMISLISRLPSPKKKKKKKEPVTSNRRRKLGGGGGGT